MKKAREDRILGNVVDSIKAYIKYIFEDTVYSVNIEEIEKELDEYLEDLYENYTSYTIPMNLKNELEIAKHYQEMDKTIPSVYFYRKYYATLTKKTEKSKIQREIKKLLSYEKKSPRLEYTPRSRNSSKPYPRVHGLTRRWPGADERQREKKKLQELDDAFNNIKFFKKLGKTWFHSVV